MEDKINLIRVPIEKVIPNSWNPNVQSPFMYEKEVKSIKKHGLLLAPLVREVENGFYEIVDGEHRWRAAKELGATQLPVNNMGPVTEEQAQELTILMNDIKGKADTGRLSDLLKKLNTRVSFQNLEDALPYSKIELDALIKNSTVDFSKLGMNAPDDKKTPSKAESLSHPGEDWETISFRLPEGVAEQWEEQLERFKQALHPDDDPAKVSPVLAIECMIQHLAQLEDSQLI